MGESTKNNIKRRWVLYITLVLVIGVFFVAFNSFYIPQDTIIPGVSILGVDVGGLSKEEAGNKVNKLIQIRLSRPITMKLVDQERQLQPMDFSASVDLRKVVMKALQLGRQGNLLQQWQERRSIAQAGRTLRPQVGIDEEKFKGFLTTLAKEFDQKPKDARLLIKESQENQVIPDEPGRKILLEATSSEFKKTLLETDKNEFDVVFEVVRPRLTETDFNKLNFEATLAQYATSFDQGNANRTHNIKVAAEAINGYVLFPQEVFSFNQVVGSRTKENDYKESLIILDNEFVPGTGGGVCQVSSTLYNVVLLSTMEIVERRNHSRPVAYLPLGLDATVLDNKLDLKFKNPLEFPVVINTLVKGGTILIKFFGASKLDGEVKIYTSDMEEIPPGIKKKEEPGLRQGDEVIEEGKPGYKVTVWRERIQGGKVIKKEKISKDFYNPVDSVFYVGTGEAPIFEELTPEGN